jgi:hypothetical protein
MNPRSVVYRIEPFFYRSLNYIHCKYHYSDLVITDLPYQIAVSYLNDKFVFSKRYI